MAKNIIDLGFAINVDDASIDSQADKFAKTFNAAIEKGLGKNDALEKIANMRQDIIDKYNEKPSKNLQNQINQLQEIVTITEILNKTKYNFDFGKVNINDKTISNLTDLKKEITALSKSIQSAKSSKFSLNDIIKIQDVYKEKNILSNTFNEIRAEIENQIQEILKVQKNGFKPEDDVIANAINLKALKQSYNQTQNTIDTIEKDSLKFGQRERNFYNKVGLTDEDIKSFEKAYEEKLSTIDISDVGSVISEKFKISLGKFELISKDELDSAAEQAVNNAKNELSEVKARAEEEIQNVFIDHLDAKARSKSENENIAQKDIDEATKEARQKYEEFKKLVNQYEKYYGQLTDKKLNKILNKNTSKDEQRNFWEENLAYKINTLRINADPSKQIQEKSTSQIEAAQEENVELKDRLTEANNKLAESEEKIAELETQIESKNQQLAWSKDPTYNELKDKYISSSAGNADDFQNAWDDVISILRQNDEIFQQFKSIFLSINKGADLNKLLHRATDYTYDIKEGEASDESKQELINYMQQINSSFDNGEVKNQTEEINNNTKAIEDNTNAKKKNAVTSASNSNTPPSSTSDDTPVPAPQTANEPAADTATQAQIIELTNKLAAAQSETQAIKTELETLRATKLQESANLYTAEIQEVEKLQNAIKTLIEKINEKTSAINAEAEAMTTASETEVKALNNIVSEVLKLQETIKAIGKINFEVSGMDVVKRSLESLNNIVSQKDINVNIKGNINDITVDTEKIKNEISSAINQGKYTIKNIDVDKSSISAIRQSVESNLSNINTKIQIDTPDVTNIRIQSITTTQKAINDLKSKINEGLTNIKITNFAPIQAKNVTDIKNSISEKLTNVKIQNLSVGKSQISEIKSQLQSGLTGIKIGVDTSSIGSAAKQVEELRNITDKKYNINVSVNGFEEADEKIKAFKNTIANTKPTITINPKLIENQKYEAEFIPSQNSLNELKTAIQAAVNSQPLIALNNIDASNVVISKFIIDQKAIDDLKNKISGQIGNIKINLTIPKIESIAGVLAQDIEAIKSLQLSYQELSRAINEYKKAQDNSSNKSFNEIQKNIKQISELEKACNDVKVSVDSLSNSLTSRIGNVAAEISKFAEQNIKIKEINDVMNALANVTQNITFPISDSQIDSINSTLKRTEGMFAKVIEQLNNFKNIDSGALDVIKNWEVYISRLADKITAVYTGIKNVISATATNSNSIQSSNLSTASKTQTNEGAKQVQQANSKTEQAQIQTSEAAKQTAEAKQQTEQAKAKTAEAQKQTQEVQKQSAAESKKNKSDNQKYSETTLKELNKLFASGNRANLSNSFTQQLKTKQSEIETLVKQIGTEQNAYTQTNIDKVEEMKRQYADMLNTFIKASPSNGSVFGFDVSKISAELDKLSGKLQFKHITSLNAEIARLKQQIVDLKPSISKAGSMSEQDLKNLQTKISGITAQFINLQNIARESLSNDTSISSINKLNARFDDLIAKMQKYYTQNTKIQRDHNIDSQFRSMVSSAQTLERSTANLNQLNSQYQMLRNTIESKGLTGRSIGDELKYIAEKIGLKAILGNQIYRIIGYFKQMVTVVKQIDTGMTSLKRVSDETAQSYKKFLNTAKIDAKELGSELNSVVDATSSFARLGYNLQESSKLAQNAIMYKNVGWLDIETATNDLVSTMKAFNITAEDSIKIVDTFDTLGNKFALTSADVGSGLKSSASALAAANNTMEQSAAMITAITEITQDSSNAGNALKILAMRLRGASAELEADGEDIEGMCDSTSSLREKLQSLAGVDIMLNEDTFKSTYQIMSEIAHEWNNISDINQAALLETIAGKTRANQVAALLNNWSQAEKALENSLDSAGTAAKENEIYLDSIEGKIAQLKATAQGLSNDIINSSWIKGFVDTVNTVLTGFDSITDGLQKLSDKLDHTKNKEISKYFDTWKSVSSILTAVTVALTAMKKEVGMKMPFTPATEWMHKPENCWEALMPVYQSAA